MKLNNIKKIYHNKNNDVEALKDITLEFKHTGLIVILGSSGCGKSTLLNIMSGIDKNFFGEIIDNEHIEYIAQDFKLFEEMSVLDNCLISNHNLEKVHEYLELFDLKESAHKKVKKCSNGMKKRIQIIRALLTESKVLLCDEPTAALDHENKVLLMKQLKKISDNCQIIVVTHDIALAEKYADRIIQMGKGIVESDSVIHQGSLLENQKESKKQTKINTLIHSFKAIVSRPIESILIIFMGMAFALSLAVSNQLFSGVKEQIQNKDIWKSSLNNITAVVNEENRIKDVNSDDVYYYKNYDIYYQSDIDHIIENHPEIIAVHTGYNGDSNRNIISYPDEWKTNTFTSSLVNGYNHTKEYANVPYTKPLLINKEKIDEFVTNEMIIIEEKGYLNRPGLCNMEYKGEETQRCYRRGHERAIVYTYLNDQIKRESTSNDGETMIYDFYEMMPYEIVNNYSLPIYLGNFPQKDNEIVVGKKTAEFIIKQYGFKDMNDLIDKEIEVATPFESGCIMGGLATTFQYTTLKISGISLVENESDYQVFFKKKGYFNTFIQPYLKENADAGYTTLGFLLDPKCDFSAVNKEINEEMKYQQSSFKLTNQFELNKKENEFYNSNIFKVYSSINLIVILLILFSYSMMTRKRRMKETRILRSYHYSSFMETVFRNAIVHSVILILLCAMNQAIVKTINQFARLLELDHFLVLQFNQMVIYVLISFIAFVCVECLTGGVSRD